MSGIEIAMMIGGMARAARAFNQPSWLQSARRAADFVRLAQAFGVDAVRAGSPGELTGALASALAAHRPALIEVPVGEFPSPWHLVRNYAPGKIPPPPNPLGEPRK